MLLLCVSACAAGLKGQYYEKGDLKYRVEPPRPSSWSRVGFAENDLAWVSDKGHVLAMNATCGSSNHGDPSLEVLTTHLLMGFTDKELKGREPQEIDGRDALVSQYDAKLDGIEVELLLAVLKKNDCVHDFSYVAPKGELAVYKQDFEALLDGFTTSTGAPPPRKTAVVKAGEPTITPAPPEPEAKAP
jgi:hypothetical protein